MELVYSLSDVVIVNSCLMEPSTYLMLLIMGIQEIHSPVEFRFNPDPTLLAVILCQSNPPDFG